VDVLKTRFGNPRYTATQHGARHLWHAARAFGYAEDLNARLFTALDYGARI
jgi:hypothetical protein